MESVSLEKAKEQVEDLVTRATRDEDVRISDPKFGTVKLTPVAAGAGAEPRKPRVPGRLKGILNPPFEGFFDPLTEEELKDWYGE